MKSEKGMALIPLLLTIFVLLALMGATIFMVGDGIFYNKDVKMKNENTVTENTVQINTVSNEQ